MQHTNVGYANQGFAPQAVIVQPRATVNPGIGNQTIIIQPGIGERSLKRRNWSSGICGCCDDCTSCCLTLFCSECYLCYLYHIYYEFVCTPLCVPGSTLLLRTKHRSRHNIKGNIIEDCCKTYWCYWCAICQLKRDMDYVEDTEGDLE